MCHSKADGRAFEAARRASHIADGGSLLDRIMEGLSSPRSRRVLYCLAEEDPREIDDVAAAVASLETETSPDETSIRAIKIDMYHRVLPKLAQLQLIEYDPRSGSVCFRDAPDELVEFLSLCRELDDPA